MKKVEARALKTLGILGGGQLAEMISKAAKRLGFKVAILAQSPDSPAAKLADQLFIGSFNNRAALFSIADVCDVLTLENEFVDSQLLADLEQAGYCVYPSSSCLALIQDKFLQKRELSQQGIPVPRFAEVSGLKEAVFAFQKWGGRGVVIKKRRNAYDGRGNAAAFSEGEIKKAWELLKGDSEPLYIEEFCPFEKELAVIVSVSRKNEAAVYPVAETIQENHVCRAVLVPAAADKEISDRASEIARKAVEGIGGVGSMGVELFLQKDGEILVNEISPRVHNSGHYTIEACESSQFENHVRGVFGLPLGSSALKEKAAAMVNLLGVKKGDGTPEGLDEAKAVLGASVHIYGKKESFPGRKMGHVTALGENSAQALKTAQQAAALIRFGARSTLSS